MLILVSLLFGAFGVWYLIDGGDLVAGFSLMLASAFGVFLSMKALALEKRLAQESKEHKKLAQMVARQANQRPATKSPSKREPKDPANVTKAPKAPRSPKPRVPKPPAPEPPEYLEPESPEFLYPEAPDDVDYGPEEPAVNEPDPFHPAPEQIPPAPDKPPVIITRTSTTAGGDTQETWTGERTWSRDEIDALIELYSDGNALDSIALSMRLDKKDVVYKLTRLNFGDSTDLENVSEAPNHGKSWSKQNSEKLLEMNSAGMTLSGMAKTFGRTKLAIGWRLALQNQLNRIR